MDMKEGNIMVKLFYKTMSRFVVREDKKFKHDDLYSSFLNIEIVTNKLFRVY